MEQHQKEAVDLVKALSVPRAKNIACTLKGTTYAHEVVFLKQITLGLRLLDSPKPNLDNLRIRYRRELRRKRRISLKVQSKAVA